MTNSSTVWRRSIGCLKFQVVFRKRAANYRVLLREMTSKIRHLLTLRHPGRKASAHFAEIWDTPDSYVTWRSYMWRGSFHLTHCARVRFTRDMTPFDVTWPVSRDSRTHVCDVSTRFAAMRDTAHIHSTHTAHIHSTHTAHIHSTHTAHIHSTHTAHIHSTHTAHIHSTHTAHIHSTYTAHIHSTHTAHIHSTHTQHAHSTHTQHTHNTYTQHTHGTHTQQTHSTHTQHKNSTLTQHTHSAHTQHTHSTHTQHTHSTHAGTYHVYPCIHLDV